MVRYHFIQPQTGRNDKGETTHARAGGTFICGEGKVQPTYSVKDSGSSDDPSETEAAMLASLETIARHTRPK